MKSYLAGSLVLNWCTAIYLLGCQLFNFRLNGTDFWFFSFNCRLDWSCDFTHEKLIALQWTGMAIAIAGLAFVFADSADSKVNPWGVVLMFISMLSYMSSIFWV